MMKYKYKIVYAIVQKFGVCKFILFYNFFLMKLILFVSKDALNWLKLAVKTMLQKISVSNKCFFL